MTKTKTNLKKIVISPDGSKQVTKIKSSTRIDDCHKKKNLNILKPITFKAGVYVCGYIAFKICTNLDIQFVFDFIFNFSS